MLRKTESARLMRRMNGATLNKYLEEDRWRLENNFFGLKVRPDDPHGVVLLLGARSGIEILRLLSTSATVKVVALEPHETLKAEIITCMKQYAGLDWERRLSFCSSVEQLDRAIPGRKIGIVRVDQAAFDSATVLNLLDTFAVDHIAGAFDPFDADPLAMYRACRGRVRSFYWRVSGQATPLSFSGPKSQYEVTVVVPSYKVLPWVDRCMETLVNQTIQSLEIIAVDDGSPDATGARLDEWAAKYPGRVKVIHKPNGGCASARNAGLKAATGDYIAFVDADDWVDEKMFEELYRSAILNATDVAQCGYLEAFEDSGRLDSHPTAWGGTSESGTSGLVRDPRSFLTVKPTIWRRIHKRAFLLDNGIHFPEHIRRFDDLPFQFEVLARVKRMSIIPDCFYYYRQEREGQDIAVTDQRLFVHFPIFEWLHDKVGLWADNEIEIYLTRCKINTHFWALSRIDRKYRALYLSHAAHDVFAGEAKPSLREMLRLARSGMAMVGFIGNSLVRSKLKKPPMIAFN